MKFLITSLMCFCLACSAPGLADYQKYQVDQETAAKLAGAGPRDVIAVRVTGHKRYTEDYEVALDGTISFPDLERVEVAGKSKREIEEAIRKGLEAGYLREAHVSVTIKVNNSKKIHVLGQVHKPGVFLYEEKMSIVQAIALAGGFAPLASKNRAIVRRVIQGIEKPIRVPIESIMTDKTPNFLLRPGDIIFVPETVL